MKKIVKNNQKKRILSVLGAAIICLLAGLWMVQPSCADAAQTDEETVLVGYYENEVFQEGAKAGVSEKVPAEWRPVIEQMLIGDPEQRCSIEDVCRKIIPGYRSIDVNANAGNGFIFAENLGGL